MDISNYGDLEVKCFQAKNGDWHHGQFKKGTLEKHGRVCITNEDGEIIDSFYFDNKLHGPSLEIIMDGSYCIDQFEYGKKKSSAEYSSNGDLQ